MRKQKINSLRRFGLLLCCSFLCFITGCRSRQQETEIQSSQENDAEESINGEGFVGEEKYEQDFIKPETNSNIFIDLRGYSPEDKKQAYFLGENLSREFFVYDKINNKLVYTGELKDTGKKDVDGKCVYKGDFSEVTEPGVYYIQTAVIGQSYAFTIDTDRYRNQLQELKQEFLEQSPADYYGKQTQDAVDISAQEESVQRLYSFQKLATAYSFFGEVYGEEYEKKLEDHAQWFLSERETVLAGRAEEEAPDYNNPGSREQLIAGEDYMFASAMGAGYMVLHPYNAQLASQCLSQAQKAYQNAAKFRFVETAEMGAEEKAACREVADMQYMAAASLNRVTGSYIYRNLIKNRYAGEDAITSDDETIEEGSFKGNIFSGNQKFWGTLFYMTTSKNADMEICSAQMKELMNACGEYSTYSAKSAFGVASQEEEPLECGIWLTLADYTIVSREYRDVGKAQMHFLLSRVETVDSGHQQKSAMMLILGNLEREATE